MYEAVQRGGNRGLMAPVAAWLLALACLACASPVQAGEGFVPPEGCTAYLTVQMRECRVEHHYSCADAPGDRFRVAYTEAGPVFESRIDSEARWVSSRNLPDGGLTETLPGAEDPASLTTLLETGEDAYAFDQRRGDGSVEHVVGEDRIVERNVVIGGEVLHRTVFEVRYLRADGSEIGHYTGAEYVSEKHRRFFSGRAQADFGDVQSGFDRTPKAFVYPGQPGFGSLTPIHDCGAMTSALEVGHA